MRNRRLEGAGALALMVLSLVCMLACGPTDQGPAFSTETGNPPTIDGTRVALVVVGDGVRIVGQPGAVADLPATVYVTELVTEATVSAQVSEDGSFTLMAPGDAEAVYAVRIVAGQPEAPPPTDEFGDALLIAQGSSQAVAEAPLLPCAEQGNSAADLLETLVRSVDRTCESDTDCVKVDKLEDCAGTCPGFPVSLAGREQFQALAGDLGPQLCPDFLGIGTRDFPCEWTLFPCDADWSPVCVSGQCTRPGL